jgi:predicted dehydrogenase
MQTRIGLIGAGGISAVHINSINQIKNAKLVAVADIDRSKAEERAKLAGGAEVFTDFRQMLDKVKLDALWICTPQSVRENPIDAAIEKKIPVFCEKPVADNLKTAQRIAKKIEKAKHPVMVGYVLRYLKITNRLREFLAKDKLIMVNSCYACPMSLNYKKGNPFPLWFYNKKISGGAIIDQSTHLFDMMRYLVSEIGELVSYGANTIVPKTKEHTVEDTHVISFRFKNGLLGTHTHTWSHPHWRSGLMLYGEKGFYDIKFMANQLSVELDNGESFSYAPKDDNMYYNEDIHFVDMVRKGDFSKMHSSYSDGLKTFELTLRCVEEMKLK